MKSKERFITKQVSESVPKNVILAIWGIIEEMEKIEQEKNNVFKTIYRFRLTEIKENGKVSQQIRFIEPNSKKQIEKKVFCEKALNCEIYVLIQLKGEMLMTLDY
jgi:Staphylococcal protein of unknown function (DUF960)